MAGALVMERIFLCEGYKPLDPQDGASIPVTAIFSTGYRRPKQSARVPRAGAQRHSAWVNHVDPTALLRRPFNPPIAAILLRRRAMSKRAITGREQVQQAPITLSKLSRKSGHYLS